jgi:hypothetical protein
LLGGRLPEGEGHLIPAQASKPVENKARFLGSTGVMSILENQIKVLRIAPTIVEVSLL